MKSIKKATVYFMTLIACVAMMACSSNSDDAGSGGKSLSAKIDGADFVANSITIGATITNNVLVIQGGKSNGETIRANIMNYTGAGTYTTGNSLSNASSMNYITLTPVATWTSTFNIGSGTLVVSSDTGSKIEGTFNFQGVNGGASKSITNGKFSIEY